MEPQNVSPRPDGDTPASPAREWLERERQRKESAGRFYPSASGTAVGSSGCSDASRARTATRIVRSMDLHLGGLVYLIVRLFFADYVNRLEAVFISLVALAMYQFARKRYKAYRRRQRANQADALKGGTSDD